MYASESAAHTSSHRLRRSVSPQPSASHSPIANAASSRIGFAPYTLKCATCTSIAPHASSKARPAASIAAIDARGQRRYAPHSAGPTTREHGQDEDEVVARPAERQVAEQREPPHVRPRPEREPAVRGDRRGHREHDRERHGERSHPPPVVARAALLGLAAQAHREVHPHEHDEDRHRLQRVEVGERLGRSAAPSPRA